MNRYLTIIIFMTSLHLASAQVDVTLNMTQKLGGEPFAYNSAIASDLGFSFNMTRMAYYISEIKLIHDGGLITPATDVYILVDPSVDMEFELGEYPIISLEKIQFSIGVDSAHNHLDPATYPAGHALAPQDPTMHWGWFSGYRFIAIEGKAGADSNSLTNNYQIHTIGDLNYRTVTVDVADETNGESLSIHLQADYEKFLDDIDLSSGLIFHGGSGVAKKIADNSMLVFSALETTGIVEPGVIGSFSVTPNPVFENAVLSYEMTGYKILSLNITDLMGRSVYSQSLPNSQGALELEMHWPPGIYIARLFGDSKLLAIEKISIQ